MSPSFNSARLSVEVGGLDLSVLALSGQEGLSQPFCYHLDILAAPAISCEAVAPGTYKLLGASEATLFEAQE